MHAVKDILFTVALERAIALQEKDVECQTKKLGVATIETESSSRDSEASFARGG